MAAPESVEGGIVLLVVHHLGISQSERIVWLCEELGLPYELRRYDRDPQTMLAPPAFKALTPMGVAPVIEDSGVVLSESGAVIDYILARYGHGRLVVGPASPDYPEYLFWYHFANGTMLPAGAKVLAAQVMQSDHPFLVASGNARLDKAYDLIEARLAEATFFAGAELTVADIMMVWPLTSLRAFAPRDLAPYPHLRAYLQRIGARPAYQAAVAKAEPEFRPPLG